MIDGFVVSFINFMIALKSFLNMFIVRMIRMKLFKVVFEDQMVLKSSLKRFAV